MISHLLHKQVAILVAGAFFPQVFSNFPFCGSVATIEKWYFREWQIDRAKLRGCHGAFVTLGSYAPTVMQSSCSSLCKK